MLDEQKIQDGQRHSSGQYILPTSFILAHVVWFILQHLKKNHCILLKLMPHLLAFDVICQRQESDIYFRLVKKNFSVQFETILPF